MRYPRSINLLIVASVLTLKLGAQAARPNAYSITEIFTAISAPSKWSIYRNGSKVVVDRENTPEQTPKYHSRRLYDLSSHTEVLWAFEDPGNCKAAAFKDDELELGDPFSSDVAVFRKYAKEIGDETISGVPAKVYLQASPGRILKMWIDPESGAAMKVEATLDGKTQTTLEVLKLSAGKPPDELFVVPAACAAVLKAAPPKPAEKK